MFVFSSGQRDAGEEMDEQYDFIKKNSQVNSTNMYSYLSSKEYISNYITYYSLYPLDFS